jgi:undecaprenyl-diphosphatase
MTLLDQLNVSIFHAINGVVGLNRWLDFIITNLEGYGVKGWLIIGTFGVLWNQAGENQLHRRKALLVTLFAVTLSILIARAIAYSLPFEVRPRYAEGIGYRPPMLTPRYDMEAWSGFPSDQAAMMFSVAVGFSFASLRWGVLIGFFATITMLARVAVGIHYPGDILVGALIGGSIAAALNISSLRALLCSPLLSVQQRLPSLFYFVLFAFLYEMCIMFNTVRALGKAIFQLLSGG